jgi:hypothetical protein
VDVSISASYFVNSLAVAHASIPELCQEIDELKKRIASIYGASAQIEFHGYEVFYSEKEGYFINGDYEAQKSIYVKFLKLVMKHEIEIYIKGTEFGGFTRIYWEEHHVIHNAAITWNLEKVQKRAREKYPCLSNRGRGK